MTKIPGMIRPELQALPQIRDRMTFLYLEHCVINREDSAITVRDDQGCVHVPAASISVLLLGPGTTITHRGMELIGDSGVSVFWVGEHGVRYYAGGRPLTHRADMLQKQAELVSNTRSHLAVARRMYEMRFPNEDVSTMTMQQLRGREGARIRRVYSSCAKEHKVDWNGRQYDQEDFAAGDPVNQALTAGSMCLYGLAHAVIMALGCSPGLGFVHVGHENSFTYDIADLYKAEVTIPLAFEVASEEHGDYGAEMRRRTRDALLRHRILERMVRDIHRLLLGDEAAEQTDVVYLWNEKGALSESGKSYGDH